MIDKIPMWQCVVLAILAFTVPFLIGQILDGDIEVHKNILNLLNGKVW